MISQIIGLLLFILLSPFFLIVSLIIYIDDGSENYYRYGDEVITGSGWTHIAFVFDDE